MLFNIDVGILGDFRKVGGGTNVPICSPGSPVFRFGLPPPLVRSPAIKFCAEWTFGLLICSSNVCINRIHLQDMSSSWARTSSMCVYWVLCMRRCVCVCVCVRRNKFMSCYLLKLDFWLLLLPMVVIVVVTSLLFSYPKKKEKKIQK